MDDVNNDGSPNWDPYANPPAEQVHTTWDIEGLPHTVTENYAQPTNAGQWTSDAWMTAAATTTLTWASQVTSDVSISQTQWQSETETWTQYTSAPTTTATDTSISTDSISSITSSSQTSSATTEVTTTTTSSTTSPSTTSSTTSSTASATNPPIPSTSSLPTKTKIAIAVPISLIGTALLLALLILLLRYRRRHKSHGSGPYMDIRENPSTHVPSHAHSDSQGGNAPNPWDTMTPHLFFLGGTPGAIGGSSRSIRSSRHASERDVSVYDVTNPHQQLQGEMEDGASAGPRTSQPNLRQGFHRPSVIVSDGFIPDPLHSHPNTPIMDAASVSGLASASASALSLAGGGGGGGGTGAIGLARTTTHEPAHEHDHSSQRGISRNSHTPSPKPSSTLEIETHDLERHRPQSPFNHPLDDAVSEISRFSGRRSTFFGGHGAGQGHHYRGVDDRGSISSVSSVSSVSDDEGDDVGRGGHSRRR
ncbi:uncharacterized protein LDX57_011151 [Aspergillus melleus]|uniref:uncharacterized protein n=1 Tax=Aspergillus melleus TaxID=138277 RepID=UPI001E8E1434|nr:uncharacterized protein LDX57_011151 [Aspergillus melleus]KAH8433517.1 hypothetical protein LDX57_011151 [Aspergillus melleus]